MNNRYDIKPFVDIVVIRCVECGATKTTIPISTGYMHTCFYCNGIAWEVLRQENEMKIGSSVNGKPTVSKTVTLGSSPSEPARKE
jgi:hypothetical protein